MINLDALALKSLSKNWTKNTPFSHFVIDDFFDQEIAQKLENEFPAFNDTVWHEY